ncbi:ArsR family transcriptional regulator [Halorhabdus sp. CBA1104]|uniref:ArsR family transcriptional regulator n=1 Tax=Halorhabdus sp. CBA1104 TaxID=1380432 RepID=UPI0012B1CEFA|nr:ArsR family transcriptional regulator [Halorhabdus sp. CBA1104]QGN07938.1 ArsR family transcriptional regulator [Halorhabdus sp. CBA1104]
MRKQGDWMANWDDRFLEYIYDHGGGTPTEIADSEHIRVSNQYISKRLRELSDRGLLNRIGRGSYTTTKAGRYYLAGAYDAESEEFLEQELRNYQWLIIESENKLSDFKSWLNKKG